MFFDLLEKSTLQKDQHLAYLSLFLQNTPQCDKYLDLSSQREFYRKVQRPKEQKEPKVNKKEDDDFLINIIEQRKKDEQDLIISGLSFSNFILFDMMHCFYRIQGLAS